MIAEPIFPTRQSGLSIIGVLFALVIGLIVIGTAASIYTRASAGAESQQLASDVATVVSAIQTIYPQGHYDTLSNVVLIDSGLLPSHAAIQRSRITLPGSHSLNVAGGEFYSIELTGLSASTCTSLVSAVSPRFKGIMVGGRFLIDFDPSQLTSACKNFHPTDIVTLTGN